MSDYYNAADDLISRNLAADRRDKVAFIDDTEALTYGNLAARVDRFANLLRQFGVEMEQRVILCLQDGVDFPVCFLGAIQAGAVPIPLNTLLTDRDYAYIVEDSRAVAAVVSAPVWERFAPALKGRELKALFVSRGDITGVTSLDNALAAAADAHRVAPTRRDDTAFWLYTSGTTGSPKGAIHRQTSLVETAELYATPILGLNADDVCYSVPKLFFAYGLGNSLTFPMAAGATSVLLPSPPRPEAVSQILQEHRPSVFFCVPTMYAMLLANRALLPADFSFMRACVSAGEALPEAVASRWRDLTGITILDGLGSTEMLHIFLSNTFEHSRSNTSGRPVEGYELKIVDDDGTECGDEEIGELLVKGPTAATGYWCQRERSVATFQGPWTRTGDKYYRDPDGFYHFCGRANDMLKVGGIYVSPGEVEGALLHHEAVLEAAVVGRPDEDGLIKPHAFVVLAESHTADSALERVLIEHVRVNIAEFKRPRWVTFIPELPKTATGKIQRFKLREGQ